MVGERQVLFTAEPWLCCIAGRDQPPYLHANHCANWLITSVQLSADAVRLSRLL